MSGYSDRRAAEEAASTYEANREPRAPRTQTRWQSAKNGAETVSIMVMIRGLLRSIF